jgi:hypothetical protein
MLYNYYIRLIDWFGFKDSQRKRERKIESESIKNQGGLSSDPRIQASHRGIHFMSRAHCRDLDIRLVWFGIFLKSTGLRIPSSMAFRILSWTRLVDLPRALAIVLMLYPSLLSLIMAGASRLRSWILIS